MMRHIQNQHAPRRNPGSVGRAQHLTPLLLHVIASNPAQTTWIVILVPACSQTAYTYLGASGYEHVRD